jgi:hypothetical protein
MQETKTSFNETSRSEKSRHLTLLTMSSGEIDKKGREN